VLPFLHFATSLKKQFSDVVHRRLLPIPDGTSTYSKTLTQDVTRRWQRPANENLPRLASRGSKKRRQRILWKQNTNCMPVPETLSFKKASYKRKNRSVMLPAARTVRANSAEGVHGRGGVCSPLSSQQSLLPHVRFSRFLQESLFAFLKREMPFAGVAAEDRRIDWCGGGSCL